ncbi:ribosomal protein subunit S26 [Schizosaccharomyces cryophilus OY26]|uniref:Ribosomal protein subunit S26 n=1 Tax=Schizosaccharomyces cryophilus (strain OY26 / ATCC MYA-4695 / CBS 11777 / NBRC 106824 / NRRL Y48691) TaxID=653667 RepID=S9VVP1_SCHCR|nr:ribosomal protein subunit S26 [Schizosaccharomyces cryophilus OY26]EPY50259.1 ribosomal protein subunit S26 [Schizosaccharomyces cryophilus OY26]
MNFLRIPSAFHGVRCQSPHSFFLQCCKSIPSRIERNRFRCYHTVPEIPERKLNPLFSDRGVKVAWDEHQGLVVKSLNDRVKGTELEDHSIFNIIFQTAVLPEHAATFQFASQAYNNHFFFESLIGAEKAKEDSKTQFESNPVIQQVVLENFESKEDLLSKIKQLASNTFGAAWIWVVLDDYNRLQVIRTFQAGTPFLWTRWQSNDPHLVPSVPDHSTRPRNYSHVPLLNLCLWDHAYFTDFGLFQREQYIDTWFQSINWSLIEDRLKQSLV